MSAPEAKAAPQESIYCEPDPQDQHDQRLHQLQAHRSYPLMDKKARAEALLRSAENIALVIKLLKLRRIEKWDRLDIIGAGNDGKVGKVYENYRCFAVKLYRDGINEQLVRFIQVADTFRQNNPKRAAEDAAVRTVLEVALPVAWMEVDGQQGLVFQWFGSSERPIEPKDVQSLRAQIDFLHELSYVHLDITERNVLMTDEELKLLDYDCVCKVGDVTMGPIPPESSANVKRRTPVKLADDEHLWKQLTVKHVPRLNVVEWLSSVGQSAAAAGAGASESAAAVAKLEAELAEVKAREERAKASEQELRQQVTVEKAMHTAAEERFKYAQRDLLLQEQRAHQSEQQLQAKEAQLAEERKAKESALQQLQAKDVQLQAKEAQLVEERKAKEDSQKQKQQLEQQLQEERAAHAATRQKLADTELKVPPPPPLVRLESVIVKDASLVAKLLSFFDKPCKQLSLLYRHTRDGKQVKAFHDRCDGKGPTLTIVRTDRGFICGGYTAVSWASSDGGEYQTDASAWLFHLMTPGGEAPGKLPVKPDRAGKALWMGLSWGPYFGGGNDLRAFDGNGSSYSTLGDTYPSPNGKADFLTGTRSVGFTAAEVEVFAVQQ